VLKLLELHEKYGKIVRITPNDLSWVDDGVWRDAWAHRQGHQEFPKDTYFRSPQLDGSYGILSANREEHQRYRRLLSHAFSDKGMREQQPIIQSYIDMLVDGLRFNAKEGSQDMVKWFNWTTFDVIGRLAFGEDFGCLEKQEWHRWVKVVFGNIVAITVMNITKRLGIVKMLPYIAPKKSESLCSWHIGDAKLTTS
jgi:averantin hydroxylase